MTDQPKPQKAVMTERDGHLYIDGDGGIEMNQISGDITPALTVEEWRDVESEERSLRSLLSCYGDGLDTLTADGAQRRNRDSCNHVLIALANAALPDTDPRKITRADVEACRKFDFNFGIKSSVSVELGVEECDAIALLARKLAALLPPAE